MMKNLSILFLFSLLLISCAAPADSSIDLSETDMALTRALKLDPQVMRVIRSETAVELEVFSNKVDVFVEERQTYEVIEYKDCGVKFKASQYESLALIDRLASKLKKHGHHIILTEDNFGTAPNEVAVLKAQDQFELIEMMGTDGANHGLTNSDIIKKLKSWNQSHAFHIVGVSNDWILAQFKGKPVNLGAFAKEVYDFCPDVVDQGTGSVEALATEMKMTSSLYLWWD